MSFEKNNLNKLTFIFMIFFTMCSFSYGSEIDVMAKNSIQKAKDSLLKTEELLNTIPSDSEQYKFIFNLIKEAKKDWDIALDSYNELIKSQKELSKTDNIEMAKAFESVSRISAQVATVHADAVTLALSYIELIANGKTAGLEKVKSSINELTTIKDTVLKNKNYIEKVIVGQFTDSDGDGYSDAAEIKGQSDPDDADSTPSETIRSTDVAVEQDVVVLEQAMDNIVLVSSALTELNVDLVDTLILSDLNDISEVEDISLKIDNIQTLQSGANNRFNSLIDIVMDSTTGISEELSNSQNELSSLIDAASDVSTSILLGDEITVLNDVDVTFDVLIEDVSDDSSEESTPNIYTDIGQSTGYQETMNTLHDIFRDSSTTVDGGGFGENNATPE